MPTNECDFITQNFPVIRAAKTRRENNLNPDFVAAVGHPRDMPLGGFTIREVTRLWLTLSVGRELERENQNLPICTCTNEGCLMVRILLPIYRTL